MVNVLLFIRCATAIMSRFTYKIFAKKFVKICLRVKYTAQNSFRFDGKRIHKQSKLQFDPLYIWSFSLLLTFYNIILLFSATVFQGVVYYRNNKWTKHWMDPGHETFWLDPKPSKCTFVLLAQLRTQMPFKNNMQAAEIQQFAHN